MKQDKKHCHLHCHPCYCSFSLLGEIVGAHSFSRVKSIVNFGMGILHFVIKFIIKLVNIVAVICCTLLQHIQQTLYTQSFCFLDIKFLPLKIKLHLIAIIIWMRQYCITMDIAPESTCHSLKKKNRCHMTPLPLHNGHFLLSPRWPMRIGLIVLQLSTNRVVFFKYGICGYFIPTIQSHSTLGWIERLKFLLRSKMTFCIWIELCWLRCWITK